MDLNIFLRNFIHYSLQNNAEILCQSRPVRETDFSIISKKNQIKIRDMLPVIENCIESDFFIFDTDKTDVFSFSFCIAVLLFSFLSCGFLVNFIVHTDKIMVVENQIFQKCP